MNPSRDIERLLAIMAALRNPAIGCPWDIRQTFETIAPFTQEEAAEVADAIARGDMGDLREELGDLLLQVVYHARMASEAGFFDFGDVVEAITAKMIRRHPHVFGDAGRLPEADVNALWDEIKREERAERASRRKAAGVAEPEPSRIGGVLPTLPALVRATRLQNKAATARFEWPGEQRAFEKVREEVEEVAAAMSADNTAAMAEEIGDLLLATANLARMRGLDPEVLLHAASAKFEQRFRAMEREFATKGAAIELAGLPELEAAWARAKAALRAGNDVSSPDAPDAPPVGARAAPPVLPARER